MKILAIAVAAMLGLYGAYVYAYPSVTVRYRLALQVEADGKQHTGSGVIQATYGKNITLLGSSAEIYINIKGEAVAVDIPGRGTLFAVLKAEKAPVPVRSGSFPRRSAFGAASVLLRSPASIACAR